MLVPVRCGRPKSGNADNAVTAQMDADTLSRQLPKISICVFCGVSALSAFARSLKTDMRPGIVTHRLKLRELAEDDLDFAALMLGDPEVMRYYPKQLTRDESLGWIKRQISRYALDGHGLWLVSLRQTGEPVGQVGLVRQHVVDGHEQEMGWLLHRPYWGNGYATEAAFGVRDYAFQTLGIDHVISLIRPVNEKSRRVAERLGMKVDRRTMFHGYEHEVWRLERQASDR